MTPMPHPEPNLPETIRYGLERYLDDDDATGLAAACEALRHHRVDMAGLLDWIAGYPASAESKSLAERRVRAALGLPLIAGPVCRR